jgi:hypothetical protein
MSAKQAVALDDDALAAAAKAGPPGVKAKELRDIVLLRRRIGYARLDIGPFLALYTLITIGVVGEGIKGNM